MLRRVSRPISTLNHSTRCSQYRLIFILSQPNSRCCWSRFHAAVNHCASFYYCQMPLEACPRLGLSSDRALAAKWRPEYKCWRSLLIRWRVLAAKWRPEYKYWRSLLIRWRVLTSKRRMLASKLRHRSKCWRVLATIWRSEYKYWRSG